MPIKAGLRTIGVTFMRDSAKPEIAMPAVGRPGGPHAGGGAAGKDANGFAIRWRAHQAISGVRSMANVDMIIVSGPFNPTGRGNTPSREKIFICRPASEKDERPVRKKF